MGGEEEEREHGMMPESDQQGSTTALVNLPTGKQDMAHLLLCVVL